jgi:hypothetical protein
VWIITLNNMLHCWFSRPSILLGFNRLLVATFRSLVTTATSCGHHSEVNVPGLLLRCPAELPSGPFHLSLHCSPRLRSRCGQLHRSDPLPDDCPASPASPQASTPPWGFSSPQDRSVLPDSVPGKPALRIRPISLRSPLPIRFRFRLDQRFRSATFP